ncbi:MAG: hypothetical protein ACYSYV_07445 [Planctomycetota bacterium]|jgi:hypothetical protein
MNRLLWQSRWKVLVLYIALAAVFMVTVFLTFFTNIFRTSRPGTIPQLVWFLISSLFLVAVILILSKAARILDALEENSAKLERIAEALEKNRSVLMHIDQGVRLSDTAKTIAFRNADRQLLREAVFTRLQQQDFDTTYRIIDEIARRPEYKEFAEQLRAEANRYRDASDGEREKQVMAHIEKLFESYQWAEASAQIESLVKANPQAEEAKALRQKLLVKKEERKKVLLTAWDDAVRRQATNRSLEILRELDQYLTANEGLALQEAAKDVFKTKLHNLGVQFSLAVSGKKWPEALRIGREITRDFPNSKIAEEIRETWNVLEQKVQQQPGG